MKPSYFKLYQSGEFSQRIEKAFQALEECRLCPWDCGIDRTKGETKVCMVDRYARVSSHFAHLGEEEVLSGYRGSGTIFFNGCNLRCVFCQNYDISHENVGEEVTAQELAKMMLDLQSAECHNINFVSPSHVIPQILEALPYAIDGGLHLPLVYNSNGFESLEALQLLDGIVDIYMPDFKFWSPSRSKKYLKTVLYPQTARLALKEMHRQVGDLQLDRQGLAIRGLLVRHLIMPDGISDAKHILKFLARKISPNTYVNLMDQYHPAGEIQADKYQELNRRISTDELSQVYQIAIDLGLHRFDQRPAYVD